MTDILQSGLLEQDAVLCIQLTFMVAFHRGKRGLQELISTNRPGCDGHVSLLAAVAVPLSFIQDKQLSTQGADDILSALYFRLFLDIVIYQFVEAGFLCTCHQLGFLGQALDWYTHGNSWIILAISLGSWFKHWIGTNVGTPGAFAFLFFTTTEHG